MLKRGAVLTELEVKQVVAEGNGLARYEGMVVFIKGALSGDVVDVMLTNVKKDYAEAKVVQIKTPSPFRRDPQCRHFGTCGGCKWQNATYQGQLSFKAHIVQEALVRIGKLRVEEISPIMGVDDAFHYRNKMEYTFSDRAWLTIDQIASGEEMDRRALGFHVAGAFAHVTTIEQCLLQDEQANIIRNKVFEFCKTQPYSFFDLKHKKGFLRNLVIRNTTLGEWMVTLVVGFESYDIQDIMAFLLKEFPFITSLNYIVNPKRNDSTFDLTVFNYHGRDYIIEQLGNIRFKISVQSFFQTNSRQAKKLYDAALALAALEGDEVVYDLYTGTGSIALYLANSCSKVVGIEQVSAAIEDAKFNASLNGIDNASFYVGSVEDLLDEAFVSKNGHPDVVVTDPPRGGMHPRVIDVFNQTLPKKIIYISCNPVTQARDIQLLSGNYNIQSIQPVDMFPQTFHVENIIVLERNFGVDVKIINE
ncbi:MAG: 23S rRNA (uracil(1939)-C(5))-methyltransferase RlmD [Chitinophagales bacterium]|nr:23S rRNA (uracil(1939)-C(5))-methyltransferase RlmD [Chitinophagales bacterium]